MQDAELFIHMAEIAGVFVGFGALIAVRSGGQIELHALNYIRWVVAIGIWVVIAALTPIVVSGYGVSGRELWLVCSLIALAVFVVAFLACARAPENLAEAAAEIAVRSRVVIAAVAGPTIWVPTATLVVLLVLLIAGSFPGQSQALYLTAVGLGLFMSASGLFVLVFSPPSPATAPGEDNVAAPPPPTSAAAEHPAARPDP